MKSRTPQVQEVQIDESSPFYAELETERAIIASMFHELRSDDVERSKYERLKEQALRELYAPDFFLPEHAIIWREMQAMLHDGTAYGDLYLLACRLRDRGLLEGAGGSFYLAQLFRGHFTCLGVPMYTERLKRKHSLRRLHQAAEVVMNKSEETVIPEDAPIRIADWVIDKAEQAKLHAAGLADDITAEEATKRMLEQATSDVSRYYPTGFCDLDAKTNGIGAGEMVIIAARPSMGKSMLARQIALNMAAAGVGIGYISIEETPEKVMRNLAANFAGIENEKMRKGVKGMTPDEFKRLNEAAYHLSKLPLRIADKSRDLQTVLAQIDRWKTQHGIEALIIDYLQRISTNDSSDFERVSRCSREIADAIKVHELAGIVVAQINRGVESRESKIPSMSDLRSSGQIEQDADGIIFLHREDYWHKNDNEYTPDNAADLIVEKWRDGERNYRVQLNCFVHVQRFTNRAVEIP